MSEDASPPSAASGPEVTVAAPEAPLAAETATETVAASGASKDPQAAPSRTRSTPQSVMWITALVLLGVSAYLFLSNRHELPQAAVPIEGIKLDLSEAQASDGLWVLEGKVHNGPADVALAQFGVTYIDEKGQVVAVATVDVRDLKAAQTRDVKVPVSGYTPGLKRVIVPIRFQRPD